MRWIYDIEDISLLRIVY